MLGNVLLFNTNTNEGEIEGVDKRRYYFHIGEWLSNHQIKIGQKVIYDIEEDEARNIKIEKIPIINHIIHVKINFSVVE
jgi:cold shock CspA family protein